MLQGIYGLLYGIIGCCMGSFLGLCAIRFRREESVWSPRSHCDDCGHPLGERDLVPLLSYFFNNGKCRFCGAEIPARYFWQELVTGCLFLITGLQNGPCLLLWVRWGILSLLLLLSFLDMEEMQLYEELFYPLGALFLMYRLLTGASLGQGLLGAAVLGSGLELLRRWKPESLGQGDPILVGLLGFWLGSLRGGESLLWAAGSSFLFVLYRGCRAPRGRRRTALHAPVPFGPFLCGSAFLMDCRTWGLPDWLFLGSTVPLCLGTLTVDGEKLEKQLRQWTCRVWQQLRPWPRQLLSVVLGPSQVLLLQGQRRGEKWEVERYAELAWPERLQAALEQGQAGPVAQWLQEVCVRRGFTAHQVNLALAPEWTASCQLSLPELSWKEQQEEASWEVLQQLPYEAGTFSLALLPYPGRSGEVLAQALPNRQQELVRLLVETMGWKLLRLEPLAQAWGRWQSSKELTLVLLLQGQGTAYGWIEQGCLVKSGLFPPGDIPEVDRLPEQVLLGGGRPEERKEWKEALEQEWGCPVQLLEWNLAFRWAPCYEELSKRLYSSQVYGALGGLLPGSGTREFRFSLSSGEPRTGELLPRLAKGTLAVTFLAFLAGNGFCLYWAGQKRVQQERLQQGKGWALLWQEQQERNRQKQQGQEMLKVLKRKKLPWTPFLTLLGNTVPADCWITRIQQENGKEQPGFCVEGSSLNRRSALQFVQRLQQQPCLDGIRLERLEEQPEEGQSVRFALHGEWKGEKYES